jgi:hypothetical protein
MSEQVCHRTSNEETFAYLEGLAMSQFWGAVGLKFEAGSIVHIRKEESLRPNQLSEKPRERNASINTLTR